MATHDELTIKWASLTPPDGVDGFIFVEASLEQTLVAVTQAPRWHRGRPERAVAQRSALLAQMARYLRPLIVPTRGSWTLVLSPRDHTSLRAGALSGRAKTRSVHLTALPGHVEFAVFEPGGDQPWDPPWEDERIVQVHRESRWEFYEKGEPFPFEQVQQYEVPRVRDRLTPRMLFEYAEAMGINVADPSWYRWDAAWWARRWTTADTLWYQVLPEVGRGLRPIGRAVAVPFEFASNVIRRAQRQGRTARARATYEADPLAAAALSRYDQLANTPPEIVDSRLRQRLVGALKKDLELLGDGGGRRLVAAARGLRLDAAPVITANDVPAAGLDGDIVLLAALLHQSVLVLGVDESRLDPDLRTEWTDELVELSGRRPAGDLDRASELVLAWLSQARRRAAEGWIRDLLASRG